MTATIEDTGAVDVQTTGDGVINTLVLFQNDGERVGYRVIRDAPARLTLNRPVLTDTVEALRADLQTLLIEHGLFPREARAMVETWRDTWFAPGTRIFYLVPRAIVDAVLPLQIDPQPLDVTRVFVGRIELSASVVQPNPASPVSSCAATPR
jgi:hypothetical protein